MRYLMRTAACSILYGAGMYWRGTKVALERNEASSKALSWLAGTGTAYRGVRNTTYKALLAAYTSVTVAWGRLRIPTYI